MNGHKTIVIRRADPITLKHNNRKIVFWFAVGYILLLSIICIAANALI
jgi:hypothetical protein